MNVMVIDVGSSSVRVMLMDAQANLIPNMMARRKYNFDVTLDGGSTIHPDALRTLTEASIDELLYKARDYRVDAVGMSMFVGNVMGVDADGRPVTPVYTYADSRAVSSIDTLRLNIDERARHQETGCMLHTAYHPARLHWLKTNDPQQFRAAAAWMDYATYCYRRWFGRGDVPCSYSVASWSGLLDRRTLTWHAGWLEQIGLDADQFPALADFTDTQTGLSAEYAERWPTLKDTPFFLALGDGAAANIGTGGTHSDRIVLTVGTTAAIRVTLDSSLEEVPYGLWNYRIDAHRHLLGGATNEGGSIYQWVSQTVTLPPADEVERALMEREADSHGLTFLPLFFGERSPNWQAHASGTIHGIRMGTQPLDLLQAALEGVALRLAIVLERMNLPGAAIYASGGALNSSPAWARIMTNTFSRRVYLLAEGETTARGVALLVMGIDGESPVVAASLEPDANAAAMMQAARMRQEMFYQLLYG